jgi:hypothetical protein
LNYIILSIMEKFKKSFLGGVFANQPKAPPVILKKEEKPQSMVIHAEEDEDSATLLRKRNAEVKRLEQENASLRERNKDLEKTVSINKEIVGAIIDSIQQKDYSQCFTLFQAEIKNLLVVTDR